MTCYLKSLSRDSEHESYLCSCILADNSASYGIDYDFADEEGWLCYSVSLIIIIHLFKCIACQNEETYRYDEEHDSETLTLQGQSELYVIGKASVISGQSNEDCKEHKGAIKEYKLQLSKKPCSHSDCGKAVKKAKEFLLEEYPGCLVKQYGTYTYGPKCKYHICCFTFDKD